MSARQPPRPFRTLAEAARLLAGRDRMIATLTKANNAAAGQAAQLRNDLAVARQQTREAEDKASARDTRLDQAMVRERSHMEKIGDLRDRVVSLEHALALSQMDVIALREADERRLFAERHRPADRKGAAT
jgi:chromosome segregation ATPase